MRARPLACVLLLVAVACSRGSSSGRAATSPPSSVSAPEASTTTNAAPPTWQSRATAPTARQEVASAVLDGRVWVVGGLAPGGASTVVETYDPSSDRWSPGPALPFAVHHAAATTYHGEVVVLGGFVAADSLYARASDRVVALRGGAWVDLPKLRRPRGAAAAAVAGDALVVAGGRNESSLIGPTEVFDGSSWRDAEAIPTRRDHLSAASDGRSVFTVGGRFLQPGAVTAALERFDPAAGTWERLPAMPTARGGQGAALAGARLVVAGGEDPTHVYPEVESYDLVAQRWSALPPLPTPRHGVAVELVGGRLLVLVGGTSFGVAPSAVAESLSPLS